MKLGVYDIINDPLPKLYLIKEINVKVEDFEYDEDIVKVFNKHLCMDKLDSEYMYALSLSYGLIPRGIVQLSSGNNKKCNMNIRKLGIGLLLTGAEQFMCFHNHPGGNKKITLEDRVATEKYEDLAECIGIDFIRHIMITKDYWEKC